MFADRIHGVKLIYGWESIRSVSLLQATFPQGWARVQDIQKANTVSSCVFDSAIGTYELPPHAQQHNASVIGDPT